MQLLINKNTVNINADKLRADTHHSKRTNTTWRTVLPQCLRMDPDGTSNTALSNPNGVYAGNLTLDRILCLVIPDLILDLICSVILDLILRGQILDLILDLICCLILGQKILGTFCSYSSGCLCAGWVHVVPFESVVNVHPNVRL